MSYPSPAVGRSLNNVKPCWVFPLCVHHVIDCVSIAGFHCAKQLVKIHSGKTKPLGIITMKDTHNKS